MAPNAFLKTTCTISINSKKEPNSQKSKEITQFITIIRKLISKRFQTIGGYPMYMPAALTDIDHHSIIISYFCYKK